MFVHGIMYMYVSNFLIGSDISAKFGSKQHAIFQVEVLLKWEWVWQQPAHKGLKKSKFVWKQIILLLYLAPLAKLSSTGKYTY